MPKLAPLLIGLITCIVVSCGNKTAKTGTDDPQNNNYLVSMNGVDSLKLGMSKTDLEKLVNTPIKLPNLAGGGAPDTVNVKYKGMDMIIYFDGGDDSTATIRGIQTSNPACKTDKAMGVGSDKLAVIDAYEDFTKYVAPEYETYPVRSTTRSAIAVADTFNTNAIVFHILSKKVASVEVVSYYEFY